MFLSNGISLEDILGKKIWQEVCTGSNREHCSREIKRAVDTNSVVEFENFYSLWNKWFSIRAHTISGGGVALFTQDISDSKKVVTALRESETRYRSLFKNIDSGFCACKIILDHNGLPVDYKFIEVHLVFCAQTGLPLDSVGKTALELVPNLEKKWI